MTIQNAPAVPVGGFNTIGQIDATNPLCFHQGRIGLAAAVDLLSTHTAGAPLVDDQGTYFCFLNAFDVMRVLDGSKDLSKLLAKDIMRKDRLTVTDATPIAEAAKIMEEHHVVSLRVEKNGKVAYSVRRHDLRRARIGVGGGMGIDP